jgi:hypothetical protein
MAKIFTIDFVKFQDKYLDAIKNNIKLKYKELYPNNKITIKYSKGGWDGICRFDISIGLQTFSKQNKNMINTLILLDSYTNIEAINVFSDIDMEEYLEEYDDHRRDYKSELQEYIESIMVTYKLMGVNFNNYKVDNKRFSITINSQHLITPVNDIIGTFQYDILTKKEFENIKIRIIDQLQSKIRYINGKSI